MGVTGILVMPLKTWLPIWELLLHIAGIDLPSALQVALIDGVERKNKNSWDGKLIFGKHLEQEHTPCARLRL